MLVLAFVVYSLAEQRFDAVQVVVAGSDGEHQWSVLAVFAHVRLATLGVPVLVFHGLVLAGWPRQALEQILQHG